MTDETSANKEKLVKVQACEWDFEVTGAGVTRRLSGVSLPDSEGANPYQSGWRLCVLIPPGASKTQVTSDLKQVSRYIRAK